MQEVKGATGDGARAAAGVSEEAALTLRSANASRIPIDEIPAPIYLFDPETLDILAVNAAIVISNRTIESMLGYSRQDLVGQPVDRLLPERYRGRHFLDRVRWLVDRGATFHFSFTGRATSQYSQRRIDG